MANRVLVVDDEQMVTDGLLALLELENIDAVGAYDVDEAERLLRDGSFAVVLADVRIQTEEEGLHLLGRIRELNPAARVASMSGSITPDLKLKLGGLGSSVVLEKPMSSEQIVAIVQSLLDDAAAVTVENAGALYVQLQRSMYSIPCKRFGFDSDEAQDIVQEAFSLYLEKMNSVMSPKPWLTGTIVNLCKQRIQKRITARERIEDVDLSTLEAAADEREDVIAVREALSMVDERTRALCTLIGIEGLSYDEVSERLGMPVGSIGPSYIRAKAKLRKFLETVN